MYFRNVIYRLMIILIVLQSGGSFADIHQFHQIPLPEWGIGYNTHDVPSPEKHDVSRCTHCCHCHGQGNAYVSSSPYRLNIISVAYFLSHFLPTFPCPLPFSLFRPPTV